MKLIVGLGNPGKKYERTRHNVGFEVVEELARRWPVRFRRSWGVPAETAKGADELGGELLLVKPLTYMNRSGEAVAPLLRKKGLSADNLIVVLDDAELPLGKLRIRKKGSAGGHNGLKSLIAVLGTEEFARVRVGVGRQEEGGDLADHVLGVFSRTERKEMEQMVGRAADALLMLVRDGADAAMNTFN